MSWKAIETKNGEAQVIDTETNQVIARIVSGPFKGIKTAEWMATAPDTLRLLAAYKRLANLRQEIDSQEEQ
jgi:hypothetical protein